jgi:hypothetical protein
MAEPRGCQGVACRAAGTAIETGIADSRRLSRRDVIGKREAGEILPATCYAGPNKYTQKQEEFQ